MHGFPVPVGRCELEVIAYGASTFVGSKAFRNPTCSKMSQYHEPMSVLSILLIWFLVGCSNQARGPKAHSPLQAAVPKKPHPT